MIYEGEMILWSTFPAELQRSDSYGVPGSTWWEPKDLDNASNKELLEKYKWMPINMGWPQLGKIYLDGEWRVIDGYEPPVFAPGYSGKNEVIPEWILDFFDEGKINYRLPKWAIEKAKQICIEGYTKEDICDDDDIF